MTNKIHEVHSIKIADTYLYLTADGQPYQVKRVDCSAKLTQATSIEREYVEVSPSKYGLHWAMIDEDLAIDPLLRHAETLTTEMVN
jgi:hypothetical protein